MTPYYSDTHVEIYLGDCRDVLPTLDDASFDHVITDPPYSANVHKRVRSSNKNSMPDAHEFGCRTRRQVDLGFEPLSPPLRRFCAREFARLAKRWVMAFSDVEMCHLWRLSLGAAGLDYCRTMEWRRLNGAPQFTGDRPASSFEAITLAHQPGKKRWNGGGKQGVYEHPIVMNRGGNTPRRHTTPKPLLLMSQLVCDFSDPSNTILDPFMGSGTTLRAAKDAGRKAVGVELSEAYCESAAKWMAQEVLF